MIADSGVYIAKFKDGYRVTHAIEIGSLHYYPKDSLQEKNIWYRYFSNAVLCQTEEEAFAVAHKMAREVEFLEHGISYLGHGVDWREINGVELIWN